MRVCRQCGNPFMPLRPGDRLCAMCDPQEVPFPPPLPELLQDVRDGWGG